ncbi:MAG: GlsB/YeaQ/YmgE family stress response membrane protein [Planctomycetia bacterium]|nr:GlsB/YeaQ/YmgE family stress response membrane protein [Planctomycetia bacterium]
MFAIIGWAIFGLIVGLLARLLVPGRQAMGLLATMALGVVGSLIGGAITWMIHGAEPNMYQPSGWIMSIIGGIIVVVVALRMQRTA